MNVGATLKTVLGTLVAGRITPNTFPQEPLTPTWPAIRYTVISRDADIDIEGTDDGEADDIRVQLDLVAKSYEAARSLRNDVVARLIDLTPPCARVGEFETYDVETKTHRVVIDVLFAPSTSAGSPV